MTLVFDFSRNAAIDSGPGAVMLLDCYQKALGHELPNRLVAVQGLARLILLDQADRLDEDGKGYFERLAQSVRQADELVRALADLGRLLRDPGPAESLDLAEMAREELIVLKVLSPGRVIEYHLPDQLPPLTMPRRPWQVLFSQLFRFLLDATPVDRPCRIDVHGQQAAGSFGIQVAAPGMVCREDELKALIEPFSRGPTGPGAGLGLFPVQLLVAFWGGCLTVTFSPAEDACFDIAVPRG